MRWSIGVGSTSQAVTWGFYFFETDPHQISIFLFAILAISAHMEETFFGCYETGLNLDYELVKLRPRFAAMKEQQKSFLKTKYKIVS